MSARTSVGDVFRLSILELGAAFRARQLSPLEVTQALLERIARLEPRLRSYVRLTPEIALGQAQRAHDELLRGVDRGPMHGVPIGIKDLCETRGVATGWGTRILADHVPLQDCTVVSRLFSAGAVMLGKLKMTEGAFSAHHPSIEPPRNPWHPEHWPGVSSSGSGVAVAAGLCFGAIGTDTGGSIRFPSGACSVTGLKPTWGRVSRAGVQPLADSLDHIGPMTRSAADAGAMFAAMAGADPRDPTTLDEPVPDCLAAIGSGIADLRIGIDPAYVFEGCDEATITVLEEARRVLGELGARFVEVVMPERTASMVRNWSDLCAVEAALAHERYYPSRAAEYGPLLAALLERGRRVGALELMRIQHDRLIFQGQLRKLFASVDLLLAPVHPFGNPTLSGLDARLRQPAGAEGVLRFTAPFDMSGSPTITLPGGFDAKGLPMGWQLIGRHLDEALLVRAGHAFQQVTDHHRRHPPL